MDTIDTENPKQPTDAAAERKKRRCPFRLRKNSKPKDQTPPPPAGWRHPWLRALSLLFAVLIPLAGIVLGICFLPSAYGETFLGALRDKYERLETTDEPKIVLIGGSSVAFGFDSALIEEYTGYRVVNFGLYATLGTRLMLDLSKVNIKKGDIVLLAPELDAQTLSMYFNAEAAWQAFDSKLSMMRYLSRDNYSDMAGGLIDYFASSLKYAAEGTVLSPSGIYRRDSFNRYGDIAVSRPYNVMTAGYDVNQTISLTPELFDETFLAYLNDYISWAEQAGATVYFTFCPMNASALDASLTEESLADFYRYVAEHVRCRVIGNLRDAILDEGYFYDTNFHLNDAGVTVHTAKTIEALYRAMGITERLAIELPAPPERPIPDAPDNWEENEWSDCFLYEEYGDGLKIVGVSENAKDKTALEIPYKANGKVVRVLGANALSGCQALTDLTIYENLTLLEDGAFAGCENLASIHMRREESENLEAGQNLFDGAPDRLKICLYSETAFSNFVSGYWWGNFAERMELIR